MMEWFKQNSVALQGIAALLAPLLTLALIFITWRYVALTATLAHATTAQTAISLQPIIRVTFGHQIYGHGIDGGREHYWISLETTLRVQGQVPIRIRRYRIIARQQVGREQFKRKLFNVPGVQNRVLMAEDNLTHNAFVNTPINYQVQHEAMTYGLQVECTDLSNYTQHTFECFPGWVDHYSSITKRYSVWADIRRAATYLKERAEWENPPSQSQEDK